MSLEHLVIPEVKKCSKKKTKKKTNKKKDEFM